VGQHSRLKSQPIKPTTVPGSHFPGGNLLQSPNDRMDQTVVGSSMALGCRGQQSGDRLVIHEIRPVSAQIDIKSADATTFKYQD
jgi:hypothetical protein